MRIRTAVFLGLLISLGTSDRVRAQVGTLPDTPAARRLTELVAQYNADTLDALRWKRWKATYGPLEVTEVVESTPTSISAWVRGTVTKGWLRLLVRVKPEAPHTIDGEPVVFFGPAPSLGDGTQPSVREGEFLKNAGAYLKAVASADFFSGAVLVGRGGQPVLESAHGFASRRYGARNTLDTPFNLASVTKLITAVAIAQLADAGRLSFDDTVAKHLPGYNLPNAGRITIHQLLTHTAGLGRAAFNESSVRDRVARTVSEQLLQTVAPAAFEPGASVQYNNEAWVVLGAIIERVTQQNYYAYVAEHIYKPAGMVFSGNFHGDEESPVIASGYSHMRLADDGAVFVPGARRNTSFISSISGSPAGGTYSTVRDLFRLVSALQQHKLLSPAATSRLLQQHVEQPPLPRVPERRGFGYGVETLTDGWLRIVGKSGGAVGASAELKIYPQLGYTIIVLSNYDSAAPIVERRLRELMLGKS